MALSLPIQGFQKTQELLLAYPSIKKEPLIKGRYVQKRLEKNKRIFSVNI